MRLTNHLQDAQTLEDNISTGTASRSTRRRLLGCSVVLWIGFLAWSAAFVARTSVELESGETYFCLFDDAMISMRYAWNIAHGLGPVWNPSERVEGYTNPLQVLLMVPANAFLPRRYASLAVQVLGFLLVVATAVAARSWGLQLMRDLGPWHGELVGLVAFIAQAATLAYYPLAYWSLMGMEVGLVTLLVLLGIVVSVRVPTVGRALALGLLAAAGYLTRPDALVLFFPMAVAFLLGIRRLEGGRLRLLVSLIVPGGLVLAGHFLWRQSYYGEWLPNTYVLKVGGIPLADRVANGIAYLSPFLAEHSLLLLLTLYGCLAMRTLAARVSAGVAACAIAYQVWAGGDPWWYWRLLTPAAVLMLLVAVASLAHLARQLYVRLEGRSRNEVLRPSRHGLGQGMFVVGGCLALLLSCNWRFRNEIRLWQRPFGVDASETNTRIGVALAAVLRPEAKVAVFAAGIIPYFCERYAVDLLGKCDKRIARLEPDLVHVSHGPLKYLPGHNKYALNGTFLRYSPDFVQWANWGAESLRPEITNRLVPFRLGGYLVSDSPYVNWAGAVDSP